MIIYKKHSSLFPVFWCGWCYSYFWFSELLLFCLSVTCLVPNIAYVSRVHPRFELAVFVLYILAYAAFLRS